MITTFTLESELWYRLSCEDNAIAKQCFSKSCSINIDGEFCSENRFCSFFSNLHPFSFCVNYLETAFDNGLFTDTYTLSIDANGGNIQYLVITNWIEMDQEYRLLTISLSRQK